MLGNVLENMIPRLILVQVKHLDASLLDSQNLAHPGVGPYGIGSNEPIKRHAYYQWVPFVLFGQAIMFYLTHLLWKHLEGEIVPTIILLGDHFLFFFFSRR